MGSRNRQRQKIKEYIVNRDGYACCYCSQILSYEQITLEHIVPDSKGGTFNATNLTVSCYFCNNKRGNQNFFDYCKNFNFPNDKINKYKRLYFNNLKIKILNIAKEECLTSEEAVPVEIISQACQILRIKTMNFSDYESIYYFEIKFVEVSDRKKIKYCFEQLIRIIEGDSE